MWTYLPRGPFARWPICGNGPRPALLEDPLTHTIIDNATGEAVGTADYMRIDPASGVIEIGSITYSPRLQRRPAGTEAMYLMMRRVFDELGYRRYEWKCNSLNMPVALRRCGSASNTRGCSARRRWRGPQPRHDVVLDHRQRVAGVARPPSSAGSTRRISTPAGRQRHSLASFRPAAA